MSKLSVMVIGLTLASSSIAPSSQDFQRGRFPQFVWPDAGQRYPWETEAHLRNQQKLNQVVPELGYSGAPFSDVIADLRQKTGADIEVNWNAMEFAGIEPDEPVTLSAKNVPLDRAILLVLDRVRLPRTRMGYELIEGKIRISTREDLNRTTLIVTYHCTVLFDVEAKRASGYLARVLDSIGLSGVQPGENAATASKRIARSTTTDSREASIEQLIDTITSTVDPESWRNTGGRIGSVQHLHNSLIIIHTTRTHRRIVDLLEKLREPYPNRPAVARWP